MGFILPDWVFGDGEKKVDRSYVPCEEYRAICKNLDDVSGSVDNWPEYEKAIHKDTGTSNSSTTYEKVDYTTSNYSSTTSTSTPKSKEEKRLEELARHGISPGRPNKTQQRKLVLFERELRSRGYSKKEIDKVIKDTIDYIPS